MNVIEWMRFGSCEETYKSLSDHLDDELRGLRRRRVRNHLARCERCSAILLSLKHAVAQLGRLARFEPPPAPRLADAVVDRIRQGGLEQGAPG